MQVIIQGLRLCIGAIINFWSFCLFLQEHLNCAVVLLLLSVKTYDWTTVLYSSEKRVFLKVLVRKVVHAAVLPMFPGHEFLNLLTDFNRI